jgi:hypothetical protein
MASSPTRTGRLSTGHYDGENSTQFKPGHPGGPGRPRGSVTRVKADLAGLILNGAVEAGFLETNSDGNLRKASGIDGISGYLRWCAVNRPEHYMSLLGRILPHYTSVIDPGGNDIMSYEETVAELRERGLPPELIDHLRLAPEILDPGEDPDPYGLMKEGASATG